MIYIHRELLGAKQIAHPLGEHRVAGGTVPISKENVLTQLA